MFTHGIYVDTSDRGGALPMRSGQSHHETSKFGCWASFHVVIFFGGVILPNLRLSAECGAEFYSLNAEGAMLHQTKTVLDLPPQPLMHR